MRNFQGTVFIWTQTYREIFKFALVYFNSNFNVKFNKHFHISNKPFEAKVNVFQPLNTVGKNSSSRLCTVTSSFCSMWRLARRFLLRRITIHAISQKKYSKKLEKHLWHGPFCGESCCITYHSLLKVKSNKGALLEIWLKCCFQY